MGFKFKCKEFGEAFLNAAFFILVASFTAFMTVLFMGLSIEIVRAVLHL